MVVLVPLSLQHMKLEAMSRLKAQPLAVNPISDSAGSAVCQRRTEFLLLPSNKRHTSLGIKDGIELLAVGQSFVLRDLNSQVVGYLDTSRECLVPKVIEAVSATFILPKYRGRKLGTVLYLGALHVFKRLASDSTIAPSAVMTWRSLEKFGYTVKLWCVTHDRRVDFEWGANGLPVVWGKPMDKLREEFVFYV